MLRPASAVFSFPFQERSLSRNMVFKIGIGSTLIIWGVPKELPA
jgi:hypothetical protein